jgi:hypothetical protein
MCFYVEYPIWKLETKVETLFRYATQTQTQKAAFHLALLQEENLTTWLPLLLFYFNKMRVILLNETKPIKSWGFTV